MAGDHIKTKRARAFLKNEWPWCVDGHCNCQLTEIRAQVYELYNLIPFSLSNIGWAALARQAGKMLTVCIVCSFGSTMDITAMQVRSSRSCFWSRFVELACDTSMPCTQTHVYTIRGSVLLCLAWRDIHV